MKNIILFLFIFCALNLQAQYQPTKKINFKSAIAPSVLSFVSGACWGLHEKTMHDWTGFSDRFPNANPGFWNPQVSWRNKWKDGNPELGRNGKLVWTSDAKHILASSNQILAFGAGCTIVIGRKVKWQEYALRIVGSAVGYTVGNYITYDLLYK